MDKARLMTYISALDSSLQEPADLYVYGSAACILLDEPERSSLDVDVAGAYSRANMSDFHRACGEIGLPVNPAEDYPGDHIEWVGPLRLCLPPPSDSSTITLWQGRKLTIRTGSVADLVASKLIRYDELDQADIQFLLSQQPQSFTDVAAAVDRLPPPFCRDVLLRENLENLRRDVVAWQGGANDRA